MPHSQSTTCVEPMKVTFLSRWHCQTIAARSHLFPFLFSQSLQLALQVLNLERLGVSRAFLLGASPSPLVIHLDSTTWPHTPLLAVHSGSQRCPLVQPLRDSQCWTHVCDQHLQSFDSLRDLILRMS